MREYLSAAPQHDVLEEVRRALGHPQTILPAPLPGFVDPFSEGPAELLDRFTTEAISLGATVSRVRKAELAAARIAEICEAANATRVVISGSDLLSQLGLKWQLEQHGLSASHVAEFQDGDKALVEHLATRHVGITAVDCAIAETGTIVITSDDDQALLISLLPPIHIAVVKVSQLEERLSTVIKRLNREHMQGSSPSRSATFITGPSRTSDVELTLSIGVHGPKELHLILLDD